ITPPELSGRLLPSFTTERGCWRGTDLMDSLRCHSPLLRGMTLEGHRLRGARSSERQQSPASAAKVEGGRRSDLWALIRAAHWCGTYAHGSPWAGRGVTAIVVASPCGTAPH